MRRLSAAALCLVLVAVNACDTRSTSLATQPTATRLATSTPLVASTATEIDWNGALGCVAPSRQSPEGGCYVQDVASGISLRVCQGYGDVTSAVIQRHVTEPRELRSQSIGIDEQPLTRYPSGQILRVLAERRAVHTPCLPMSRYPLRILAGGRDCSSQRIVGRGLVHPSCYLLTRPLTELPDNAVGALREEMRSVLQVCQSGGREGERERGREGERERGERPPRGEVGSAAQTRGRN